jgi:hypothetical protein
MINQQDKINRLKRELVQRQNNIHYLEAQAAAYGALNVPLKLHNDLARERELAETLQLQLDELLRRRNGDLGENAPRLIIVEDDIHWQDIIVEVAANLGYRITTYRPLELATQIETLTLDQYQMAILGLPPSKAFTSSAKLATWTESVAKISQAMPVILLTNRSALSVSIATHQSLFKHRLNTVATIPKETFNHTWFAKILKKTSAC